MAPPSRGKAAYAGIEESAQLGWRTLDGDGNTLQNNQGSFPQDDSVFAAKLPFGDPMHPDVVALREHMAENNGIPGLTVIDGQAVLEDDELAKRAAAIFHRDGFVAVSRALVGDDSLPLRPYICGITPYDGQYMLERVIIERIAEWLAKSLSIPPSTSSVVGSDSVMPSRRTGRQ